MTLNLTLKLKLFNQSIYFELLKLLVQFETVLIRSAKEYDPSILAKHALQLAKTFNHFYGSEKILVDDVLERDTKLILIHHINVKLKECMKLLGMSILQQM